MKFEGEEIGCFSVKPVGIVKSDYKKPSLSVKNEDLELDRKVLTETKTHKGKLLRLLSMKNTRIV